MPANADAPLHDLQSSQRGYGTDWQALRRSTPLTHCTACARPWRNGFHLDHKLARNAGGSDDASNFIGYAGPATVGRREA